MNSPRFPARGLRRREWLRIGGLSALGVTLAGLNRGKAAQISGAGAASFGRAKSCILLFLCGGPPQHDTFDPKPDAPLEIRGTFRSISTSVPGVNFCETLLSLSRYSGQDLGR